MRQISPFATHEEAEASHRRHVAAQGPPSVVKIEDWQERVRNQNLERFGAAETDDTIASAVAREIARLLTDEQAGDLSDMARKWLRHYEALNS